MGTRGSGGAVGAGCGAFSLLGLLIGVGLTVWLGSQVFSATSGPGSRQSGGTSDTTEGGVAAATDSASAVTVTLDPATSLGDTTTVTVTVTGLPPDAATNISTCLAGPSGALVSDRCDPESVEPVTADRSGAVTDLPIEVLGQIGPHRPAPRAPWGWPSARGRSSI